MVAWLLLALLAVLLAARLQLGYPRLAEPFRRLSRRDAAFVAAAADATFPPGGAIEPSGAAAGIPAYVDRYLDGQSPRLRLLLRLLFLLVEQATLVFPAPGRRGFRRFSSLPPEQRVAVLEGWRTSRLFARRVVFTSLRAILAMAYLGSPAVLRRIGLAPLAIEPVVGDADLLYPPVGRSRSAIPYRPQDRTPPSDGAPLEPDGPLHPAYAEDTP